MVEIYLYLIYEEKGREVVKKRLAVVSSDTGVRDFIIEDVKRVLGDLVEIHSFSKGSLTGQEKDFPVVFTTHPYYAVEAERLFPNSVVIPGRKMINGHNLEQILILPKNKKVLVINNPQMAVEETINDLLELGFNQLDYVPYWVGRDIDLEGIDTAITPGMGHHCPAGIKNIIDIGYRILSIGTFLDIIINLDLNLEYLEKYVKRYNKLLVYNSRRIADILQRSEIIRKEREIIVNEIDDGIISVNQAQKVTLVNPVVERIFNIKVDDILDKRITDVLLSLQIPGSELNKLVGSIDSKDILLTINERKIICNKLPVVSGESMHFIYTFKEVEEIQRLEETVRRELHKKGYVAKYNFKDVWGSDKNIKLLRDKALQFARTKETILITGESGTGKELLAQAIHLNSSCKDGPFIAINFAAIPETLVESELFGYEGGAFTGARREGKSGIFEQAHQGTIFLDEIGDAPLHIQARLLRILQEKEIMRIGGSKVIPVNVRVIAATNKNLFECVESKQFRADLFYRLNVLPIEVPPLRRRKDDIILILEKYLKSKYNTSKKLYPEVIELFNQYDWPGNIRELLNVADYFYYSSQDREEISPEDIPSYIVHTLDRKYYMENQELTKSLLKTMDEEDELQEVCYVLELFKCSNSRNMGRMKLMAEIGKNNYNISEHKLKKYLNKLSSLDLIRTGKTKQGTIITSQGIKYLDYFYNTKRS